MRILAAALVVGTLTLPVGGAPARRSDTDREALRGPVRSVRTESAELETRRGRAVEGPRVPVSQSVFDADGDEIQEARYVDGRQVERSVLRYDADGTQVCESAVRTSNSVFGLVSLSSDAAPLISDGAWRTDRQTIRHSYDTLGNRVASTTYESIAGELFPIARETYGYDDEGRLSEIRRSSADGVLREVTRLCYGASGEIVEKEIRNGDGALERRIVFDDYRVDERGNWIRRIETETHSTSSRHVQRACYRTITYYDDETPSRASVPVRSCSPSARRSDGPCRDSTAPALARAAKARGVESQTMASDHVLFAIVDRNRYNPEKPPTAAVLAAERDGTNGRPRRVVRRHRDTVDDGGAAVERPEPVPGTIDPAFAPSR